MNRLGKYAKVKAPYWLGDGVNSENESGNTFSFWTHNGNVGWLMGHFLLLLTYTMAPTEQHGAEALLV